MRFIVSSFIVGLVLGLGLTVSRMLDPAKVLGFLDIFGHWDPSLALVMAAAVAVAAVGFAVAEQRTTPFWSPASHITTRRDADVRLIAGATLFGIGWGLVGLCPGPALTALSLGRWEIFLFLAAMISGMALFGAWSRLAGPVTRKV